MLKESQVRRPRSVGPYINNTIKFKALADLYHPELEVLWVHFRPARLLRGSPCIVSGTVYHTLYPTGANDTAMVDYLFSSLTTMEGRYPGCGILLTGDFNRLENQSATNAIQAYAACACSN